MKKLRYPIAVIATTLLCLIIAGCSQSGATDQSTEGSNVDVMLTTSIIAALISVLSLGLSVLNDRRNRELDAISILDRLTDSDMAKARDIVGQAAHLSIPVNVGQATDDLRQAMYRFLWQTQCVAFLRKEIKGNSVISIHAQVIYRHLELMIESFNKAHENNPNLGCFEPSLKYANEALKKLPKIKYGWLKAAQNPPEKQFT